ncbi:MAG: arginine repressor [Actinobacteria bacterium]|jgi:transcriptional regulator of arginine metabolism|nr:arginine repressor [Actinomycetota bacterium]
MAKNQRQHRIGKILENNLVTSQAQLVELLGAEGIVATQATVSRDLEELGAIKVRVSGGESVYAVPELPKDQSVPEDHLKRVMSDWVVEITFSSVIVLLRTPPGCAHVVASALDRSQMSEIIGTVGGDDTVMVIASEKVGGQLVADKLSRLAGL